MGNKGSLANAELVPDLDKSVPRDSDIVWLIWDLGNSHSANEVSMLVLSGSGLDLSLSVPDGGDVVHS